MTLPYSCALKSPRSKTATGQMKADRFSCGDIRRLQAAAGLLDARSMPRSALTLILGCQSASKFEQVSASNFEQFQRGRERRCL
jgi:hypothetical protein